MFTSLSKICLYRFGLLIVNEKRVTRSGVPCAGLFVISILAQVSLYADTNGHSFHLVQKIQGFFLCSMGLEPVKGKGFVTVTDTIKAMAVYEKFRPPIDMLYSYVPMGKGKAL